MSTAGRDAVRHLLRRWVVAGYPGDQVRQQLGQLRSQRATGALASHARVEDLAQRAHDRLRDRLGDAAGAIALRKDLADEPRKPLAALRPALDARRSGR